MLLSTCSINRQPKVQLILCKLNALRVRVCAAKKNNERKRVKKSRRCVQWMEAHVGREIAVLTVPKRNSIMAEHHKSMQSWLASLVASFVRYSSQAIVQQLNLIFVTDRRSNLYRSFGTRST